MTPGPPSDDLQRQLATVDLVTLVERDGVALHRMTRRYWRGLCPFHREETPSFTVYSDGGGWFCYGCGRGGSAADYVMARSGCDFSTALATLGLRAGPRATFRPLPPRPRVSAPPRAEWPEEPPTAVYDYPDADGKVRYQVLRWEFPDPAKPKGYKKTFRQRRGNGQGGWTPGLGETPLLLYRLPELLAADPSQPIYIVGGEKNVEIAREAGLVATTNSGGEGHWPDDLARYFADRAVIIIPDADEPGHHHAADVAASLDGVAASIRILPLPDVPPGGDLGDYLATHTVADLQALIPVPPPPLPPTARWLTRDELALLPPPTWLIEGLLQQGMLGMLYGPSGTGKTFFALSVALAVATGRSWWGHPVVPGQVCYVAAEGAQGLDGRVTAWETVEATRATDIFFFPTTVRLFDPDAAATILAGLPVARPALIILDTLARNMAPGDENSNRDLGLVVETATQLQQATGATILFIHHTGKNPNGARGGTALPAGLDTVLTLTGDDGLITLCVEKQRHDADGATWHFALVPLGDSLVLQRTDARTLRTGRALRAKERQVLEILGGVVMAHASWTELRQQTDFHAETLRRVLTDLIAAGHIEPSGGPPGSRDRRYSITPAGRTAAGLDVDEEPARSWEAPGGALNISLFPSGQSLTPVTPYRGGVTGVSDDAHPEGRSPMSHVIDHVTDVTDGVGGRSHESQRDSQVTNVTDAAIGGNGDESQRSYVTHNVTHVTNNPQRSAVGICPACGVTIALDPLAATEGCRTCGAIPDPDGTLPPLAPRRCRHCGRIDADWHQGEGYLYHGSCPPPER